MSTAEVTDIALRPRDQSPAEMTVEQMIAQAAKIQLLMEKVLKKDEHYGVIPGTGTKDKPGKPTLLKPGAEKLCLMFRLDPQYETMTAVETAERIGFTIRCTLYHIPTGSRCASGLGSCNSREAKYIRPAPKTCPKCGGAFLIEGKPEYERDAAYKGGMLCYQKKGGCGAKYKPDDEAITKQATGIADPADLHNTILKMACKRALVAAVLNATAASDFFTQDLEDLTEKAAEYTPPAPKEDPGPKGSGRSSTISPGTNTTPPATAASGPADGDMHRTAPASKKTTAADIAHEGVPRTPEQNKLIQVLRGKCGGVYSGDETREQWVRIIRVYRNQAGERISSSADLSKNQATHLIDRMNRYLAQVTARAEELPDLDALGGHPPDELAKLRSEIESKQSDGDESLELDLLEVFRVGRISDLPTQLVDKALALTLAWKTAAYATLRTRVMDQLV